VTCQDRAVFFNSKVNPCFIHQSFITVLSGRIKILYGRIADKTAEWKIKPVLGFIWQWNVLNCSKYDVDFHNGRGLRF